MIWANNGAIYIEGTSNITSHGIIMICQLYIDGAGNTVSLQDDLNLGGSVGNLIVGKGVFNANNHNVTCNRFTASFTTTRSVSYGFGTWEITGNNSSLGYFWDCSTTTNLTFDCGTSTIKLTDNSSNAKTFKGGGLTYNNFWNATQGTGPNNNSRFKFI